MVYFGEGEKQCAKWHVLVNSSNISETYFWGKGSDFLIPWINHELFIITVILPGSHLEQEWVCFWTCFLCFVLGCIIVPSLIADFIIMNWCAESTLPKLIFMGKEVQFWGIKLLKEAVKGVYLTVAFLVFLCCSIPFHPMNISWLACMNYYVQC